MLHQRVLSSFRLALTAALFVMVLANAAFALPANVLWYSGDPTELYDWTNSAGSAKNWQPFTVTDAAGWNVQSVFSVGTIYSGTTAEWSIRSGMSTGVAGTTVASGVGAIITTPVAGYTAIEVDIPDFVLPAGTYWLEVASTGFGSIKGSNGSNSIGTTPNLHSLRLWTQSNQIYQPYGDTILSSGVTGSAVPEPATLSLLAMGSLSFLRRKRKS